MTRLTRLCFKSLSKIQFNRNIYLDPCEEIKCGEGAICKVILSTGKAYCACPFDMLGDPYVGCGKLLVVQNVDVFLKCYYENMLKSFHDIFIIISELDDGHLRGKSKL